MLPAFNLKSTGSGTCVCVELAFKELNVPG